MGFQMQSDEATSGLSVGIDGEQWCNALYQLPNGKSGIDGEQWCNALYQLFCDFDVVRYGYRIHAGLIWSMHICLHTRVSRLFQRGIEKSQIMRFRTCLLPLSIEKYIVYT